MQNRNSQACIEPWMWYRMVRYYIENCDIPNLLYDEPKLCWPLITLTFLCVLNCCLEQNHTQHCAILLNLEVFLLTVTTCHADVWHFTHIALQKEQRNMLFYFSLSWPVNLHITKHDAYCFEFAVFFIVVAFNLFVLVMQWSKVSFWQVYTWSKNVKK